jgi:Predicted transcriptional regulators
MSDKIISQLDPVFETMGLLYVSLNYEKVRQETMKSLTELGVDGEQFYLRNFKVYDKYLQEFSKYRVPGKEDTLYFNDKDSNYFLILLSLINENRDWFTSMEATTDAQVNAQVIRICKDVFDEEYEIEKSDKLEDIVKFVEQSGLEGDDKWKLLSIMRHPKMHMQQLTDTINANLEAFQNAIKTIDQPLQKMLKQYHITITNQSDKRFFEIKGKFTQTSCIYPSLVFPVSQIISEKGCFYGLLSELVTKEGKAQLSSKEALLQRIKGLSDSSKLEILLSLKISPKYNLEIAQQLGLTAATMSHHMNVLLNCGFVGIEKKEGKVYYHLENENIKDFVEELEQALL